MPLGAFGVYQLAASFPLLVFCAVWAVWIAAGRKPNFSAETWRKLSWMSMAILLAAAAAYVCLPMVAGFIDPSIASAAYAAMHGWPLYPPAQAASRYAILYGPACFLPLMISYTVLGGSLFAAKLPEFLDLAFALFGMYRIGRSFASRRDSVIALGAASLFLLRFFPNTVMISPDPLLLACVVAAHWAFLAAPAPVSLAVTGLSMAAAFDAKMSAPIYFVPLLVTMWRDRGWRHPLTAGLITASLAPLPYFLPFTSLSGHIEVMRAIARHQLSPDLISRTAQYGLLLSLPLWWRGGRPRPEAAALFLSMAASCVTGGKAFSGYHHLMPFLPAAAHLYFRLRKDTCPFYGLALPWAATLALYALFSIAGPNGFRGAVTILPQERAAVAQIQSVLSEHRNGPVAVGYGDQVGVEECVRYVPVFAGQPYVLDYLSLSDYLFGGVGFPEAATRDMAACRIPVWLIARGRPPFLSPSYYDGKMIFPQEFRNAFLARYRKIASGAVYDVWQCQR